MNLLYNPPPEKLTVDGKEYAIYTDFRDWMRFFDMQEDDSISERDRLLLSLEWYKESPPADKIEEALSALAWFASKSSGTRKNHNDRNKKSSEKVLSWDYDAPFVYAAFLAVYHIDLLAVEYLHWHVFLGLFEALPEDTPIKLRIGYRCVNLSEIKDKNERRRIRKIKEKVRIPAKAMDALQCGDFFG